MKKRVLFIIPYMHEGGAQRALSNIQMNFSDEYEIDTLVNTETDKVYPNKGRVISLKIDDKPNTSSALFQFSALIKRMLKLYTLKRKNCYHACISFMDSANIANILTAGISHSSRTIISVRTSIEESAKHNLYYRLVILPIARLIYRKADCIVAVSEELRCELIKICKLKSDKVVAIPNGFDIHTIESLASAELEPEMYNKVVGKKIVFTSGRLASPKNQWHLIRAFSAVKKKEPNAILIIAGTGKLEGYLKETAENMGVSDSVIFLGFEGNVYRYLGRASVFVLPSKYEGYPNALGEAVCTEIPCITTDFRTGARELLAPSKLFNGIAIEKMTECEYGILTPMCSGKMYKGDEQLEFAEKELAKAITLVIGNNELWNKYSERSRERKKTLGIQDTVKRWTIVIEEE